MIYLHLPRAAGARGEAVLGTLIQEVESTPPPFAPAASVHRWRSQGAGFVLPFQGVPAAMVNPGRQEVQIPAFILHNGILCH